MLQQLIIPVAEESQVGEARRAAARLGTEAGLNPVRQGELAIVVTELGNNLRRYGRDGALLLRVLHDPRLDGQAMGVEVLAVDRGPGMSSLSDCLQDGFSSGGTPGNGLGAVRRLASVFDCHTAAGKGTVILAQLTRERPDHRYEPEPAFVIGAVSSPAPSETVCGDAWQAMVDDGGGLAVMVADGLGHGSPAAEAATTAVNAFSTQATATRPATAGPRELLERTHDRLSGTRGAAVAIASVNAKGDGRWVIRYAGVGNIAGSLQADGDRRGLPSHNGTLGVLARRFQEFDYPLATPGLLIMHSDGLQTRWDLDDYPGLMIRHPAVVAAVLHRDFIRGRDDATIVVVRIGPPRSTSTGDQG